MHKVTKSMSKEEYCYQILEKYSLLVDFQGTCPARNKVPNPKRNIDETFNQWKTRVLGQDVSDVVLYGLSEPKNQTLIKTLQNNSGNEFIKAILKSSELRHKQNCDTLVNEAIKKNTQEIVELTKNHLKDMAENSDYCKNQVVKDNIEALLRDPLLDSVKIIEHLLCKYDAAISHLKKVQNRNQ